MTVDLKQILPAMVVIIDESVSPSDEGDCHLGDSTLIAYVSKVRIPIVVVEHLVVVGECRVKNIYATVVLVVAYGDAHRSGFSPILVQRISRRVAIVFKCPVALVDVQIVRRQIVCDNQIRFAVAVEVDEQ